MFILSNAAPRAENGRWNSSIRFPVPFLSFILFLGLPFLAPLTCPISSPAAAQSLPEGAENEEVRTYVRTSPKNELSCKRKERDKEHLRTGGKM